jgi:hypothetical protein
LLIAPFPEWLRIQVYDTIQKEAKTPLKTSHSLGRSPVGISPIIVFAKALPACPSITDLDDISNQMAPKDAIGYLAQFGDGLFKNDEAAEIVAFVERMVDFGSAKKTMRCQTDKYKSYHIKRLDMEKSASED